MFALPLMFSPSSSAPVPPGPDLDFNKYFVVDDRYSDGWIDNTTAGTVGTAASLWYATPATGRQTIEKQNASPFAVGTKIRAKAIFTGGSFGFPALSGRVYASLSIHSPAGGTTIAVTTSNVSAFGTSDVHYVSLSANGTGGGDFWIDEPTAVAATDPIWIEIHKTGANEITVNVYDGSFALIKQKVIAISYAYRYYYATVLATTAGTLTRTPNMDQISYTSVF